MFCKTCIGPNENQCTSCTVMMFTENGACVAKCQEGYYGNTKTFTCHKCSPECYGCEEKKHKCTSCKGNLYLNENQKCISDCIENEFLESYKYCKKCNKACKTCNGVGLINCLSCPVGYKFSEGTCLSPCTENHKFFDVLSSKCETCDEKCKECVGSFFDDCTACDDNQSLQSDGECKSQCKKR